LGGGGDGVNGNASGAPSTAYAGTANTGGGGGGHGLSGSNPSSTGGNGGSGVVFLKVPPGYTATFSAGVTQTSATVGSNTVYTVTAAGASDTVTFEVA
jgi:hypothetical protein